MSILDKIVNLPFDILNHWSYPIIFFAALIEASPLFGLLIPGQMIVIAGGFFAKIGIIDLGDVIFFAALGAIMGDFLGYGLGRKYGYRLIVRYGKYFFFKREYFETTKRLVSMHPGKTLIMGRFHSITRAFTPFIAGASSMGFLKFLGYNIIGGVSWAISFTLVGFIFGESYEVAAKYLGRVIFIILALSVVIILLCHYRNKRKR